jgi:outer membrane protein assembly factor BamB
VAADEERIDYGGERADLTDGRVVVVTVAGKVQVRDSATGALRREATVPVGSGDTMVAYAGWLFTHDEADDNGGPHHIRATDLTGTAGSTVLGAVPSHFLSMAGCGPNRICVVTTREANGSGTVLTALDAAKGRPVWKATSKYAGTEVISARGRTWLSAPDGGDELYDAGGKLIFDATLSAGWLDAGTLMIYAPDGTGRWSRWSVADRKLTPLGAPPGGQIGFCASTTSLVICPMENVLTIWRAR